MWRSWCIFLQRKTLEMLANDSLYKITNDTAKEIARHEIAYLLLEFDFKSSKFYGLPKIHKSRLIKSKCEETQSGILELKDPIDLHFRPSVASPICETH